MNPKNNFSKIQFMWIFAMFDLPTLTAEERREANKFRKFLLADGFTMLQLSVYARFCGSRAHAEKYIRHIQAKMVSGGQVRVICVTDKQFEEMCVLRGLNQKQKPEKPPDQLLLF